MSALSVNFSLKYSGLEITLNNLSTGEGTYEWDFGDGETSTDTNPTHIYEKAGFYVITLTLTPATGTPISKSVNIGINENGIAFPIPISMYVGFSLPSDTLISSIQISLIIQKWQTIMGPKVEPELNEEDYYNEVEYPHLYGQLMASLVLFDLIIEAAQKYLLKHSSVSSSDIKSIETGPSRAEWFQGSEVWTDIMKDGGIFERARESVCSLSRMVGIKIAYCKQWSKPILALSIVKPVKLPPNLSYYWDREFFLNP